MKRASWLAVAALLSLGAVAERAGTRARTIDDPPPEPVTCPLCGGDPALHARRMFAFADVVGRAASIALRW